MRPSRSDHKVQIRYESDIKLEARRAREVFGLRDEWIFDVSRCVRAMTCEDLFNRGRLNLEIHVEPDFPEKAYMEINRTKTLHIKRAVWEDMDDHEPEAREIGAHETGHYLLHDHWAQAFSGQQAKWIDFKEESAEWQADTFAAHFLIPDDAVFDQVAPRYIAISCGVPQRVALNKIGGRPRFTGEFCEKCGNPSVVRGRYCSRCDTCGAFR